MGRARTALVAALLTAGAGLAALTHGAPPASAACATNSGRSISGTVLGEDGRAVNVSIGFDLVDRNGKALDATPGSATYGCAKTGGYSVPQTYLNHFVGPYGQPPVPRTRSWRPAERTARFTKTPVMPDGQPIVHTWKLASIPSNAVGAYIEVYARGYTGSPCRDASGNYCFNKQTLTKYGNVNKHVVPVGTSNLALRLPMTCAYGGRAGSISGRVLDSAGRPVAVKSLYAWTEATWNAPPSLQGWGIAQFPATGSYVIPSLASGQSYVMWLTTGSGAVVKRTHVGVSACKATTVDFRL